MDATDASHAMLADGVMNRGATQPKEATGVRFVGKSSDSDHPFHPYDDVESDGAALEAIVYATSDESHDASTDYDPSNPYSDPFASHSEPQARS
eukprot:5580378-Pleurochrysis_carterae.AAC.1